LLLLCVAIERTLVADERRSRRAAMAAGVLWGLATLTREIALYLVRSWPCGCCGPGHSRRRAPRAHDSGADPPAAVGRAALLVLATVLTVAPWTIRNASSSAPSSLSRRWAAQPLAGQHDPHAPADLRGPGDEGRAGRAGPLLPGDGVGDDRRPQPEWILDKLRSEMPEFWKAGSEVLDHLVGREACGPLPASTLVPIELLLVLPYVLVLALFLVGLVRLRFSGAACYCCCSSPPTTPPTWSPTPRHASGSRCSGRVHDRGGRRGGPAGRRAPAPARWRVVLLAALVLSALATLAPASRSWRRCGSHLSHRPD